MQNRNAIIVSVNVFSATPSKEDVIWRPEHRGPRLR